MKKLLTITLVILVIPQVALAAWWNPFSWNIFKFKPLPPTSQATTTPAVTKSPAIQQKIQQKVMPKSNIALDIKINGSDGPVTVMLGKPVTLRWISDRQYATCGLHEQGDDVVYPVKSTGAFVVDWLTGRTVFSITCTSADMKSISDSIEILVATP